MALDAASRVMHRAGTLFLVSDFIAPQHEATLRVVGKRHDCIAVTIQDRHEAGVTAAGGAGTLPTEGLFALEDPETGQVRLVDLGHPPTRAALLARQSMLAETRARLLQRAEIEEIRLLADRSFVEPLVTFFARRARRLGQGR
ncbi:MAG: hypothetical protein HXY24_14900 [Rubrivivax sp.]|nr:hypothetical protein [Rubrivivax sp.]